MGPPTCRCAAPSRSSSTYIHTYIHPHQPAPRFDIPHMKISPSLCHEYQQQSGPLFPKPTAPHALASTPFGHQAGGWHDTAVTAVHVAAHSAHHSTAVQAAGEQHIFKHCCCHCQGQPPTGTAGGAGHSLGEGVTLQKTEGGRKGRVGAKGQGERWRGRGRKERAKECSVSQRGQ